MSLISQLYSGHFTGHQIWRNSSELLITAGGGAGLRGVKCRTGGAGSSRHPWWPRRGAGRWWASGEPPSTETEESDRLCLMPLVRLFVTSIPLPARVSSFCQLVSDTFSSPWMGQSWLPASCPTAGCCPSLAARSRYSHRSPPHRPSLS